MRCRWCIDVSSTNTIRLSIFQSELFDHRDDPFNLGIFHSRPDRKGNGSAIGRQGFGKISGFEGIAFLVIGHDMEGDKMYRNPYAPFLELFDEFVPGYGKSIGLDPQGIEVPGVPRPCGG
jgi:hypothetical protein